MMREQGEKLCTAREGGRLAHNLGRYYTVDTTRNCIMRFRLDLEETAREFGVLQPWEAME
ncbi:MAG: hypothetical protein JNK87_08030 [Bryobacterales bacterium]|nr:hypothetical protein [Bryobacterales bacterium]